MKYIYNENINLNTLHSEPVDGRILQGVFLCINMNKPTKRKAFNFLRSYFDVLNELKEDADKLSFLMSIINKQFLDEDPKDLEFLPKLCYESQRHAIEKSVKGWKLVYKTDLTGNPILEGTSEGGSDPKEEQEQEKEQEKEESIYYTKEDFLKDWNKYKTEHKKQKSNIRVMSGDLKEDFYKALKDGYKKEDLQKAMVGLFIQNIFPNGGDYTTDPKHLLKDGGIYLAKYIDAFDNNKREVWGIEQLKKQS